MNVLIFVYYVYFSLNLIVTVGVVFYLSFVDPLEKEKVVQMNESITDFTYHSLKPNGI